MPGRVLAEVLESLALLLSVLADAWVALRPKLKTAWRVSWPALLAVPLGVGVVLVGLKLDQAGYHGAAMLLVYGSLLAVVAALAWILSDGA